MLDGVEVLLRLYTIIPTLIHLNYAWPCFKKPREREREREPLIHLM